MDKKKKKKIAWIVSIICLVVIFATTGIVFTVLKNNKNKSQNNSASNMSSGIHGNLLSAAEKAIIDGKIPHNYAGSYQFSHVCYVTFNPEYTSYDIRKYVFDKYKVADKNGLLHEMTEIEKNKIKGKNEILVLGDGLFTRNKNNKPVEYGKFVGNDNLAEVTLLNGEKFEMSLTSNSKDAIATNSITDTNQDRTKLYIYKYICGI